MLVHRLHEMHEVHAFSLPTSQYLVFHIVGMLVHRLHEMHEVHAIFSSNFISSLIFILMACWCIDARKA
jgi:hypothetical protein